MEFVLHSRITAPTAPKNIISRQNLLELLHTGRDKKITLVTAPAGYGKTTAVSEYLNQSGAVFSWYHIHKDVSSPYIFFSYIIHSLRKLNPNYGKKVLEFISALQKDSSKIKDINSALEEIIYMIINEFLMTFKDEIILVLDDVHDIAEHEWIEFSLEKLVSEIPQNLKLVIISRHTPKFNISHLRAKREILEITKRELAFTGQQIKELSQKLYSKDYSNESIEYLESSLGGWVTGIHLLIQASDASDITNKFLPDNIFDFFAEEIFAKQQQEVQQFLLTTAHLENFDASICDYVLSTDNSTEILNYLAGKNLFIESIQLVNDKGNIVNNYNYIQLFKAFLTKKSAETINKGELNSIYKKLSIYYSQRNSHEQAIDFSILAGDWESSSALINAGFDRLIKESRYEKLWQWINAIEENSSLVDPRLYHYKGVLSKFYIGKLDEALANFDKALNASSNKENEDFFTTTAISKSEILLAMGRSQQAIELLTGLEITAVSPYNTALLNQNLGYAFFMIGKYDTALSYLEKSMAICKENDLNELLADVYNIMGNIYINNGDFILSIHYYELTLGKVTSLSKRFTVHGNLAILYSRSAKYEKAYENYARAKNLYKLFKTPLFEMAIKLIDYTMVYEIGDYDTSLKLAETINDHAKKLNSPFHINLSYMLLGESSYYAGNLSQSKSYYKLSLEYIDEENEKDKVILNMLETVNAMTVKITQRHEVELLRAYSYLDTENAHYDKTSAGYYLAEYYYKTGMLDTSLKYMEKTLSLAKEKEYYAVMIREYLRENELFNYCKNNKINIDIIHEIFARVSELPELGWISPEYRSKISGKISTLFDIRMECFGGLEFIVRGKPVEDSKWIRKKRKLILAYLFLANNRSLTKDKLIDVFFNDTPLESIDNTFHQAVSNLRTALKNEQGEKKTKKPAKKSDDSLQAKEPDYVLYEGKVLKLNSDYNYSSDAEEFNRLAIAAFVETDITQQINMLKATVDIYKGDFLSGHYEEWVENLRDEYKNKFIRNSELLLEQLNKTNNNDELFHYSQHLLNYDKLNEIAYIYLIKSQVKLGKLKQAKGSYDKMLKEYEKELDEKPSKDILGKIEKILNQEVIASKE